MRFAKLGALPAFIGLYALIYAGFGVASPFWPRFFETHGLTPEEIGLLFGLGTMMRLVAGPLAGRLADLLGALRTVLATCAAIAAGVALSLSAGHGFLLLLAIRMAQEAALAPITTLADALALGAAKPRAGSGGFEYGWVRGAASAAFVAGTLIAGQVLGPADVSPIVWMQAACLAGVVFATAFVPGLPAEAPPAPTAPPRATAQRTAGVGALLRIALFRRVMVVAALVYGSHAIHDTFAVIRWNAAGITEAEVSVLWSESVAAEVLVFLLLGPKLIARLGTSGAATLAAAAGVVRWIAMAQTTALLPLALIQPLHGLTFALLHLACMRVIATIVPPHLAATAQSLYALGGGVTTTLLTLASGRLYGQYGGGAFLAMALLCVAALPLARGLRVRLPGAASPAPAS